MKTIITALFVISLSGCALNKGAKSVENISQEAIKYSQDFGKIAVDYTSDGNWIQLKSSATANLPINNEAGIEQAMNVATLRAKRNIIEFIKTDLSSATTTESITKSLMKDISSNDERSQQKASNIATEIVEKITVQSDGVIGGVYVANRSISQDKQTVSVTVQVDKKSLQAAQSLNKK
jgi:hypothetical protein